MNKQIFLFPIVAILLIISCKTPQSTQAPGILFLPDQPQILFLNLSIEKQEKGEKVTLVETMLSKGTLKKDYLSNIEVKPLHLRCSFLNSEKQVTKTTLVPNPLKQRIEYMDDNGQLNSNIVVSDNGQFTLRTQVEPDMIYLRIELISENNISKIIETLKL